jgi:hypothetical protein
LKYEILIPVLWKQELQIEVFIEEMAMVPKWGHAWCLPAPIYLNIYLQVFRIWIKKNLSIWVKDLVIVSDLWDKFIRM